MFTVALFFAIVEFKFVNLMNIKIRRYGDKKDKAL